MFIIFLHIVNCVYYFYFCLMNIAENIKAIREKQGLLQKEVALHIGVDKSTYSKIEKGLREVTVVELQKITKLFNLSADQILNYDENLIPKEVVIEDKSTIEQMQLLQQLDEEDKTTVFKIIDKMLTTKKFKDFFNKNVAAL
jgi:transcriptional regulator with XRE-family HTH domain